MTQQQESRLHFKAKSDSPELGRREWNLILGPVSPEGFNAALTGDNLKGKDMVILEFKTADTKSNSVAENQPKP